MGVDTEVGNLQSRSINRQIERCFFHSDPPIEFFGFFLLKVNVWLVLLEREQHDGDHSGDDPNPLRA